jgi:Leucine-rich repeat (LRR) protein
MFWKNIAESLIARLLNLVVLDMHSNQLKSLPNSIGCLSKLKVLNVSGNLIESLPKTIENCRFVLFLYIYIINFFNYKLEKRHSMFSLFFKL